MADRVLTLREINCATLARQMLLDREMVPVTDAVERLVGLQAQVPNPPYIGLWTRLWDFRPPEIALKLDQPPFPFERLHPRRRRGPTARECPLEPPNPLADVPWQTRIARAPRRTGAPVRLPPARGPTGAPP